MSEASERHADLITMSDAQCAVLGRMDDELSYPIRDIAADIGVAERDCRAIVHGFHAMNMTDFGPLYNQDGEGLAGRGYWLSSHGDDLRLLMHRLRVPTPPSKGSDHGE